MGVFCVVLLHGRMERGGGRGGEGVVVEKKGGKKKGFGPIEVS